MKIHVGTSGFSYPAWKGAFYPADLPAKKFLSFYASRFGTCEINNTFYRMPKADALAKWLGEVPESFSFVLKASQQITHRKRLKEADEPTAYFFEQARGLGDRLGPVLVQLPPNLKKDLSRLESFLALVPGGRRVALEFRHDSWQDDEVRAVLARSGAALVMSETDEDGAQPLVPTARFGYLRLRRCDYTPDDLARWLDRVREQPWDEAFVFFKHEDEARGPAFASEFLSRATV